jgi:catechol 2,3-dioxygenase-like lactoylglutathione lyase family enzyme
MRYLHTMVRVRDLIESLDFYCTKLGLEEIRRMDSATGRFTLVFLAAPGDRARAEAERCLSSPTIGTERTTVRRATSAISPLRSTTSMRSVSG